MSQGGRKQDKEELFERTGVLHRKLVPASDSIKEGYVLIGRHDLIPKIRKLILRATTLVFMKYKKDIVVKEVPLNTVQTVQIYHRNRACFVMKYRTRRRLKSLVMETRNPQDAQSWVELMKATVSKVSSDINELLSSPLVTSSNRRHSDPPTPNFAQQQSRTQQQPSAADDDDDEDEESSDSGDEFDVSQLSQTRSKILSSQAASTSSSALPTVSSIPSLPQHQNSAPVINPFYATQQQQQQPPQFQAQFPSSSSSSAFDPFGSSSSAPSSTGASVSSNFGFNNSAPSTAPVVNTSDPFNVPVIPHLAQQQQQAHQIPPSFIPQQQQQQAPQIPPSFIPQQQQAPQIPPAYIPQQSSMGQIPQQQQQQAPQSQVPAFSFSSLMTVPEGLRIVKEHGFVSATVIGVLTTPNELDDKVEGMKEQVQKKLMTVVTERGGNAVLGISFNISFQPTGSFVMCSFGSACSLA